MSADGLSLKVRVYIGGTLAGQADRDGFFVQADLLNIAPSPPSLNGHDRTPTGKCGAQLD